MSKLIQILLIAGSILVVFIMGYITGDRICGDRWEKGFKEHLEIHDADRYLR